MLNFIVNAHSGRGKGQRVLKKIINYCYKNQIEYTVHLTASKGHAERIAKALCDNNSSTIVAVGGDGTFHEVLNGITTPESTALGFIPSGRGNDFAKGFGIPLSTKKALERIVKGNKRRIDFLQIGSRRCLNVAGTGLDIDVLKRVDGKRGKITYLRSLLYCIFHFEPYKIKIEALGEEKEYNCLMAGACNCSQFGGGIKVSPLSKVNDGLINVVILTMPENGKILRLLPKFLKGKHLGLPVTTHFTCENLKIAPLNPYPVQLDGEIYDNLEFECAINKSGLITF